MIRVLPYSYLYYEDVGLSSVLMLGFVCALQLSSMQQDYVTTAKDATSATTRLELFTKDLQAAQEEARKAIGVAAEANARLVRDCTGFSLV